MRNHIGLVRHSLVCLPLLLAWAQGQTIAPTTHPGMPAQKPRIVEGYGRLPLVFEANQGQTDPQVKFVSRGAGYNLFLTNTEAVLTLHRVSKQEPNSPTAKALPPQEERSAVLHMKLVGVNAKTEASGQNELPGKSNYFIGNDPKKWHSNVQQYAKVRYENIYPGVDLLYYGNQRELEYDFVLQPGANPGAIRLGIEGASQLRLDHGDLVLSSPGGDVRLRRPHTYQEVNGTKQEIRGRYVMKAKNEVGFQIQSYDRRRPLIIDPVLAYSTYLGGSSADHAADIAVDAGGNAYVTGETWSIDFPIANAIQPTKHRFNDVFVSKINADGSALVYSTYLGGNSIDLSNGIAVDTAGNAYVIGLTESTDFPTANALQPTNHGSGDAFVSKINADGSALVYSTYLGGSDGEYGDDIAVDAGGNAYVVGSTWSSDFPTINAIQPFYNGVAGFSDAFLTKINATGSVLVYSTYLGGNSTDNGGGIAVDAAGNAYVTGTTSSTDFPTANALQPTKRGHDDAFISKINADGSALVYSTYLGGSDGEYGDYGSGIAVDTAGNAYVTGETYSTDFPTANAIQSTNRGHNDAFVSKINADGSALVYSTYLGGRGYDVGYGIAVDAGGNAYVSGSARSGNFPTTLLAFQPSSRMGGDAFITKIASQTFVSVSPLKLAFTRQVIGTTSVARTLTLTNQGASSLMINKIYIAGANAGDFAETNTCAASLAPGDTCTIWVSFSPTAKGKRQAALGISDSDPASPQAVALTGIGTAVSLSSTKVSFGKQPVGTTSAPKNVTLTNVGSTPLNFTGISIAGTNAGDFSQTNTCGTSIAGGASCTITVTFTPTAKGSRKATVSISDDGGGSPQKVNLTGTGT